MGLLTEVGDYLGGLGSPVSNSEGVFLPKRQPSSAWLETHIFALCTYKAMLIRYFINVYCIEHYI